MVRDAAPSKVPAPSFIMHPSNAVLTVCPSMILAVEQEFKTTTKLIMLNFYTV